ncbi:MAG: hypothetical protein SWO11_07595 [Thermodesulfobacteriota bacterium]|nr:hypothetical protein [Thermodesulfobacteriota bacterium]
MKTFLITCFCIFITLSVSFAEEKGEEDYWKELKKNVESIKQAQNDPTKEAFWKGEKLNREIGVDELDMFDIGLGHAIAGNNDEAIKTFYSFINKFPKSPLKDDAFSVMNTLLAMD